MVTFVRKNLVFLLISQSATWVVSFVLLIFTPNLLSRNEFGALAFATVFVQFFSLAAGLETGQLLTREVARDHALVGPYVRNALGMKVVVVGVLSAAAFALARLIGLDSATRQLIVLGCVGMLFTTLSSVLQGALAGMHRMARPALWTVVQLYVGAALGITVLALGAGVVAFAAVIAGATAIPLVANFLTIRPYLHGSWRPDVSMWRRLVGGGLPLLALTGLTLFYGSIDVTILNGLAGETAVAWYTLAYRWAGIPIFVCTAVVAAYFPVFSQHGTSPGAEFADAVNKALFLVVIVSAPAAFGLASIADDVISAVVGASYDESVPVLRILVMQIPIAAVDTVLGSALVASDRIRQYLYVAAGAAVLTPMTLLLTMRGRSAASACIVAAVVTTVTEIYVFAGAWRLRAPGVLDRATVSRCVRVVAAASVIVLVLWPLDGVPFPLRIPVAGVAYVVALLAFRVGTIHDVSRLHEMVRSVTTRSSGSSAEGVT